MKNSTRQKELKYYIKFKTPGGGVDIRTLKEIEFFEGISTFF